MHYDPMESTQKHANQLRVNVYANMHEGLCEHASVYASLHLYTDIYIYVCTSIVMCIEEVERDACL